MVSDNNPKPAIVGLLKMHSPDGYKLLCDSYSAVIYGSIIRIVNDTCAAEDLLKQTFKQVCSKIDEYQHSSLNFSSWILQLARAISIDYISTVKITGQLKDGLDNPDKPGEIDLIIIPSPDKLNPGTAVFSMIVQGYKVTEIADKLKMDAETVKANIRIGMKNSANLTN